MGVVNIERSEIRVSARVEYHEEKEAFLAIFYIGDKVYDDPDTGCPSFYYFDDDEGAMEMAESIKKNQLLLNEKMTKVTAMKNSKEIYDERRRMKEKRREKKRKRKEKRMKQEGQPMPK